MKFKEFIKIKRVFCAILTKFRKKLACSIKHLPNPDLILRSKFKPFNAGVLNKSEKK